MKKQISKITLLVLLSIGAIAQEKQSKPAQKVSITFKNNSLLPRKYTFVTYWTKDRHNNATEGVVLAPYATKTITDVVGTELFLANSTQINTVMSGKKIEDKAFWVFKSEDNGKTINLRND
ncbi:hypothetical protein GCM10011514_33150 [Emticicia aquatilis]|uniref:Uncharacterized protein n=1 Tax=Emticicia aquatilis TaxID=1537369 RepID=A0A916YXX4_9BACT|nr:hypothetical protein [Emticicia aquatilis]GGD66513.1 hypothetical protein GCM10011514_33150 [Emticicia aquatilis]